MQLQLMKLGHTYLIAIEKERFTTEKDLTKWFKENKESFAKDFIIITGFSYNGKLKISKIQ